jgi:hypothetical protein
MFHPVRAGSKPVPTRYAIAAMAIHELSLQYSWGGQIEDFRGISLVIMWKQKRLIHNELS